LEVCVLRGAVLGELLTGDQRRDEHHGGNEEGSGKAQWCEEPHQSV
jgi:hypothetical protein